MKLISTKINESQKSNKFSVLHYQVYNMDFCFLCWVTIWAMSRLLKFRGLHPSAPA